jgi:6-phosphogluconate dehydrogenase
LTQLVYFITGVAGSGKTALGKLLSEHWNIPFADADDFHPPENIAKMRAGIPLTDDDRAGWLHALNAYAIEQLQSGSIVIACSALKNAYRTRLCASIPPHQVRWIHLRGDYDLIRQRMEARGGHFMPAALLQSQFDIYEQPTQGWVFDVKNSLDQIFQRIKIIMQPTFGVIGLGVMGRNLARNLARHQVPLSLYNRFVAGQEERVAERAVAEFPELATAKPFEDLKAFVASLERPRKVFLMVNAGAPVDEVLEQLWPLLEPGDIVMDGGNSHYEDTRRRQEQSLQKGIHFLGVGVSGGESGALNGPAIMVGGDTDAYAQVAPFLEQIAARDAGTGLCAALVGPQGAGHFVKMTHNGIEYAEMQLLAEVYSVLRWEMGHTPDQVADILSEWMQDGQRSYLLEITINILRRREGNGWLLDVISDKAAHKGTGSWASIAASELGVPVTMMTDALFARFVAALQPYRHELSAIYPPWERPVELSISTLKYAYAFARVINHHQGFMMIQAASKHYGWQISMPEVARIWTNGCIIRSDLMLESVHNLTEYGDLLRSTSVQAQIKRDYPALQDTVAHLSYSRRAYPCLMGALTAFNGLTTHTSSAHLIQAQRDYFGAHLYERTDDQSGQKYHTNWE